MTPSTPASTLTEREIKWKRDELWHALAREHKISAYAVRDIVLGYLEATTLSTPAAVEVSEPAICRFDVLSYNKGWDEGIASMKQVATLVSAKPSDEQILAVADAQEKEYGQLCDRSDLVIFARAVRALAGAVATEPSDADILRIMAKWARSTSSDTGIDEMRALFATPPEAAASVQGEPVAPIKCALCGDKARIPPTCDACHDSMGTRAALATRGPIGAVEPQVEALRSALQKIIDADNSRRVTRIVEMENAIDEAAAILALSRTPGAAE